MRKKAQLLDSLPVVGCRRGAGEATAVSRTLHVESSTLSTCTCLNGRKEETESGVPFLVNTFLDIAHLGEKRLKLFRNGSRALVGGLA